MKAVPTLNTHFHVSVQMQLNWKTGNNSTQKNDEEELNLDENIKMFGDCRESRIRFSSVTIDGLPVKILGKTFHQNLFTSPYNFSLPLRFENHKTRSRSELRFVSENFIKRTSTFFYSALMTYFDE